MFERKIFLDCIFGLEQKKENQFILPWLSRIVNGKGKIWSRTLSKPESLLDGNTQSKGPKFFVILQIIDTHGSVYNKVKMLGCLSYEPSLIFDSSKALC